MSLKIKKLISSVKEGGQAMLAMLLLAIQEMVFYKNGKVALPSVNTAGSWKKRSKYYLVNVDEDRIFTYMNKGVLKIKPPVGAQFSALIIFKRHLNIQLKDVCEISFPT
jgi:hypothetical protein